MNRNIDDYYVKHWYKDDFEFEAIRQIALNDETNPNQQDFTHNKLVIEDHVGYGVIFHKSNDEPVAMNGLYAISDDVGRLLNRHYIFKNFRNKSMRDIISGLIVMRKLIMEPLIEKSNFKVHIMTMANRGERDNFFNSFYKTNSIAWPDHWHLIDGYVQTGNGMKRKSWQHAICSDPNYPFKTINHDQWLLLPE